MTNSKLATLGLAMATALGMGLPMPGESHGRWPDWHSIAQAKRSKTTKRRTKKRRSRR